MPSTPFEMTRGSPCSAEINRIDGLVEGVVVRIVMTAFLLAPAPFRLIERTFERMHGL
jgi:hypothetical protein